MTLNKVVKHNIFLTFEFKSIPRHLLRKYLRNPLRDLIILASTIPRTSKSKWGQLVSWSEIDLVHNSEGEARGAHASKVFALTQVACPSVRVLTPNIWQIATGAGYWETQQTNPFLLCLDQYLRNDHLSCRNEVKDALFDVIDS